MPAGDQLLVQFAGRLRGALRIHDTIASAATAARFGGDEFLIVAEGLRQRSDAARVAERLLAQLSEPYEIAGQRVSVTASIGVATSDRVHRDASAMLRDADIAMYRAKQRGRARIVLFDDAMDREISARLRLEAALREAVKSDALELNYQPVLHLADGRVEGFEALVRWTHPELGVVPANDLITAAEDTGLIQQLGLQLMRRGCRQLAAWHAAIPEARGIRLMLNLSRRQLVDLAFSARVAEVIRESGVDATKLGLEITETSVLHDIDGAVAVLERLRGLGTEVLLDDFGSGYTAISYLDRMPLNGIKIERSFVARAHEDVRHRAMLKALVALAQAYELGVVAEGIETLEERDFVRSLGVERGQGWLFSRAVPAAEAEALIRAGRIEGVAPR
jgi:predicted signal transduction protein with EAL and GGDEF domain